MRNFESMSPETCRALSILLREAGCVAQGALAACLPSRSHGLTFLQSSVPGKLPLPDIGFRELQFLRPTSTGGLVEHDVDR